MKSKRKQWIASICVAIVTLIAMEQYWDRREQKWLSHTETVSIFVMKKDVAAGKHISPDSIEQKRIPKIYVEPGTMTSASAVFGSSSTMRARIGLKAGEQLTKSKILDQENKLGLSWTLPAQQTAMAIKLSRESAVAGFVQPGDWVCVFGILDKPNVVLKQVRVLAVQDQFENDQEDSLRARFASDSSVLLTLSVRREEGLSLARALNQGPVSVALLPAIDEGESL